MMNNSDIQFISGLFNAPSNITSEDATRITSLKQQFPYFMPLHYLQAAIHHKQEAFSQETLSVARLYPGNWLLFCKLLNATINPVPIESAVAEPISEAQPEAKDISTDENTNTLSTHIEEVIEEAVEIIQDKTAAQEPLILPVYTEDYFLQQGIKISDNMPGSADIQDLKQEEEDPRSLMVMMSFSEWLLHFKRTSEKEKEESEEQRALKMMWQKEKLAAAMEEENDEIPENVFEMAVNSIAKEDDLASEPLANIYIKQGKYDKAIDMYRKLSLRNPQKNAYFARKIEEILKEKQS